MVDFYTLAVYIVVLIVLTILGYGHSLSRSQSPHSSFLFTHVVLGMEDIIMDLEGPFNWESVFIRTIVTLANGEGSLQEFLNF